MAEASERTPKKNIASRVEEMIKDTVASLGFTLWDVEFVKEGADWFLRVTLDSDGGITIDDCVDVSRELSDLLDAQDFIEDAYILEVSSPGLGRKLKKDKEFERSIGRKVDLKTFKPVDGVKEFTGVLESFDEDNITLLYPDTGKKQSFQRKAVSSVHPAIDL